MTSADFYKSNENCNGNDELDPKDNDETSPGIANHLFHMKPNENYVRFSDCDGHEVTFNVTFAFAVPGVYTSLKSNEPSSQRVSLSDQSLRNVQLFYHIEFDLFSKEITSESNKIDIGFYGSFAKIYPDRSESKIVPTWNNGHDTWVSWIQQYKVWITDHHIRSLCNHKMKMFIWDTKDKCSSKVRFDRPKNPKSANKSKDPNENINSIKQSILTISKEFFKTSSYSDDSERILPHEIVSTQPSKRSNQSNKLPKRSLTVKSSVSSATAALKESEELILLAEPKPETNDKLESYGQLEKLLEVQNTSHTIKNKTNYLSSASKQVADCKRESIDISFVDSNLKSDSRKSVLLQTHSDNYNKSGRTGLEINMPDLFIKNYTINRIRGSVSTIEDMFCKVSLERDIVSSDQKKRLNPFVIKIQKVKNIPIENKQIDEMNKKYKPVYCEYQFADSPSYQTVQCLHKKSINFDDISVILLGEMSEVQIRKQFLNSFFSIHLFNRIKYESQEIDDIEQSILDSSVNKVNMGDINVTSSLTTVTNFTTIKPQGEAKIDLSDLINKNLKFLEVTVPIVPISPLSLRNDNGNGKSQLINDHVNFLEAETCIKVSFQLSELLSLTLTSDDTDGYLTQILVVNENLSCTFIREMCTNYILDHNCGKYCFQGKDKTEMKQFLYSIKHSQKDSDEVLVGFYIIDGTCEVLLVEGYKKHIKAFYDQCSEKMDTYKNLKNDIKGIKLFYNDSLVFERKEKFPILTMIPLVLSKDISFFASQPLLYVRDMLPKNCVEGICRLKELIKSESMQVIVRNNLIPTHQMIEDLSQYLCSHISQRNNDHEYIKEEDEVKFDNRKQSRKQIETAPVISERKINKMPNHKNKKTLKSVNYIYPNKDCEFSYSSQTKNSISSALTELRNQMDPKRRYTFSQEYLFSGTVDPVDLEEIYTSEERRLKNEKRWINKGHKTLIEDYAESNNLSLHRIEDLRETWKENELNSSFLQPTLPERDNRLPYFDTYIRPLHLIERNRKSIFPNYADQKMNEKQQQISYDKLWKSKVCVSNIIFKTHRKLPQTELIERGRTSSSQLEKLKGLRKDKLEMINWFVKKSDDPDSIPMISAFVNDEIPNQSYTVGGDLNRKLIFNHVPVIKKDKDFNPYYQPSKDSFIYKNPNPKISPQQISPFSITCNL